MSFALYRFYGDAGRLLYVGITSSPDRRFGQHAKSKEWWPEVRGISVDWYDTRQAVEAAERRAIAVEQPAYNKALRRRLAGLVRPEEPSVHHGPDDYCGVHDEGLACHQCGKPNCDWKCGYEEGDADGWRRLYTQCSYEIMQAGFLAQVIDQGGAREPIF